MAEVQELQGEDCPTPSAPTETPEGSTPKGEDSVSLPLPEEIERLRAENELLRAQLEDFRKTHQIATKANDAPGFEWIEAPPEGGFQMTPGELMTKVQDRFRSDDFRDLLEAEMTSNGKGGTDAVFVAGDEDTEIGVVGYDSIGWWTLVPKNPEGEIEPELADPLDGPYVLLSSDDVIDSVACFVAQCVCRMPEAQRLSSAELATLLDGSFATLKEKTAIENMWAWYQFTYTAYGWSKTAYSVYSQAPLARMALKSAFTICKWIGLFL